MGLSDIREAIGKLQGWFLFDWTLVAALFAAGFGMEFLPPVHRLVVFDPTINFPHMANTVRMWSLTLISLGLPAVCMCLFFGIERYLSHKPDDHALTSRSRHLVHQHNLPFTFFTRELSYRVLHLCLLGLFLAIGFSYFTTNIVKLGTGRPRPDFIARCKPLDLNAVPLICSTDEHSPLMDDGRRSFPSGHSAFAFSGLGYLSLFFYDQFTMRHTYGRSLRMFLVMVPLIVATIIAMSRISDYRHHWQDVLVGSLFGFSMAIMTWTLYFKSPLKRPFAEESRVYLQPKGLHSPVLLEACSIHEGTGADTLPESGYSSVVPSPHAKTPLASEYNV